MHLKKLFVFGLLAAVLPAVAEEAADRKTATSLKYVEHELDTRQNKFTAEQNKAMEYTNTAGDVQKRAVTSNLGTSTSDTSLPMVGGVNAKLNQKQDDIDPVNDHTAVTYTGQPGGIGRKGIYQTTGAYAEQSDNLIDAKTFNAALKNGLDSEFVCSENRDPVSGLCWLYTIHNIMENSYVSATGTVVQDGIPTPTNPIYPQFFQQGDMILRRVGDYADSFDAATHKITRRVGVMVLDGTENWNVINNGRGYYISVPDVIRTDYRTISGLCSQFLFDIWTDNTFAMPDNRFGFNKNSSTNITNGNMTFKPDLAIYDNVAKWKAFLAAQYAAGTPVTVYYPLATPVEEDYTETTYNENVYIPQNQ